MASDQKTVVFLATYNEAVHVEIIYHAIRNALPDVDILFVDDNSPDGTGAIIDKIVEKDVGVFAIHRKAKLGIGSAHKDALKWALNGGYGYIITMDCDFAHSPDYLKDFLNADADAALVTGTRFKNKNSLSEWTLYRRIITHTGHILTRVFLSMPFDATGAFRRYNLRIIPREFIDLVVSDGYPFFFESLHILYLNGLVIKEIPIHLPARTYGSSKMRYTDVFGGLGFLFKHSIKARMNKHRLQFGQKSMATPEAWDGYWREKKKTDIYGLYDRIAKFYRLYIIKPSLNFFLDKYFPPHAKILHAGCGSGMVDTDIVKRFEVTACDFSDVALNTYRTLHGSAADRIHADLLNTGISDCAFDGIYNLGVMEHFEISQIGEVLKEFHRVLKPGGKIVLFWPPEYGLSVIFLKGVHFVLNIILRRNIQLHPAEPSRVQSSRQIKKLLNEQGFDLECYHFGPRDLFTYGVVVGLRLDH